MAEITRRSCLTCGAPVVGQGKKSYCEAACNPRNRPRACPTCETPVRGRGVVYCADACRPRCSEVACDAVASTKGLCQPHYGRHLRDLRGRPMHNCETCGREIPPGVSSRTWCSEDCKPRCVEDGCDQARRTSGRCGYHYRTRGPRTCLTCGIPVRDKRRYCSTKCYPRCAVDWCTDRGRTLGYCDRHYMQLRTRGSLVVEIECGICGASVPAFKPDGTVAKASTRLCDACRESFRPLSRVSLKVLVDRDGLACSLCPDMIDLSRKWPDPKSVSIDHIQPRSRGGTNDLSNLALSHLGCNCSKGNRLTL